MKRKRFNKLMMALGIPRNDLNRKLRSPQNYKDLMMVWASTLMLHEGASYTDRAGMMLIMSNIARGQMKDIGKVVSILAAAKKKKNILKAMSIEADSKELIEKNRGLFDRCIECAKEITAGQ